MTEWFGSETPAHTNELALNRLARAITLSQGQFSLILAQCNDQGTQKQVLEQLKQIVDLPIFELKLYPSIKSLFSTIKANTYHQQLSALMVFGLESVVAIEEVLRATNWMREQFRKSFAFPVVLWVNDETNAILRRVAPDFRKWSAAPIRFEVNLAQSLPIPSKQLSYTYQSPAKTTPPLSKSKQILMPILSRVEIPDPSYEFRERLTRDYGIPEVMIIEPVSFAEMLPLIAAIRTNKSLLINLQQMNLEEAQRSVDLLAGATYALDGDQQRVGEKIFIFTPSSVLLTNDFELETPSPDYPGFQKMTFDF